MMLHFLITMCLKTRENVSTIVERYRSSKLQRLILEIGIIAGSILGPAIMYYMPCLFYNHPIPLCLIFRNFSNVSNTSALAAYYFYGYTHGLLTLIIAAIVVLGTSMLYCTTKLSPARRMVKKVAIFCIGIVVYLVIEVTASHIPGTSQTTESSFQSYQTISS